MNPTQDTEDDYVLEIVGSLYLIKQIPHNYYFPGDRLIIKTTQCTAIELNDFIVDNCFKVISLNNTQIIVEFKEKAKYMGYN